jgi:hypothetical protein
MEKANAVEAATASTSSKKKSKPTKSLPTERITFAKQLSLLRAYAVASGAAGKVATNKEAADIVEMVESTTSMANAFFVDVGFLQRADGGFLPAQEVVGFARAFEWNPETASHKLQPLIARAWFSEALVPKLSFRTLTEDQAIADLADAAAAGPDYKVQLRLLLDYMEAAGMVQRDGNMVKMIKTAASPLVPPSDKPATGDTGKESVTPKGSVSTLFAQPTEGVVQFHVSVKVDMKEFAGWEPGRITAFFGGIAQVLAAKGAIEKGASGE